jgi:hypothetical protein
MKLTKLFLKIISKEAYNDLSIFFSDFESFEEIPLISRHHRLKTLKKLMDNESISDFLVSLSFFLINSIKALSLTIEDKQTFFAVSFTDFDFAEQGILMPNIFVYPAAGSTGFLTKIQARQKNEHSTEMNAVKNTFQDATSSQFSLSMKVDSMIQLAARK